MDKAFESFGEKAGGSIMDGSPDQTGAVDVAIDSPGKRRKSLSSGAGSFVAMVSDDCEWLESEIKSNQMLRGEIGNVNDRLIGVMNRQNAFQKEATMLVGQVSESLSTLDSSRIRHEKLADHQRNQMNELMSQAQKVIAQRQEINTEMKQQWALNSQFVDFEKWRQDVEREILTDRGSHRGFSEKVVNRHVESQVYLDRLKRSWLLRKSKTGIAPELFMGGNQMVGGAEIESQVARPGAGARDIESQYEWRGVDGAHEKGTGPTKPREKAYHFDHHAPTRDNHARTFGNPKSNIPPEKSPSPNNFGKISCDPPPTRESPTDIFRTNARPDKCESRTDGANPMVSA